MKRLLLGILVLVGAAVAANAQDYRIHIGDTLDVTVLEDENLNRTVLVRPDGRISLPLAGTIQAAGLSTNAIENVIADAISDRFTIPPTVSVSVAGLAEKTAGTPARISVYVLGEVASPGQKEMKPGTTVLQAFAEAGGVTPFAATKRVQIRRTDRRSGVESLVIFNYDAVQNGAAITSNFALREGDVILVPERRLFE